MIDQQQLYNLTQKLISYPSVSPNQAGCIDYIQQLLKQHGFSTTLLNRNNTSNLVAIIGSAGPIFAFAGHIDVVPPGDLNKWRFNPYTLTEEDGEIYARGIADMKGAVAAFISASILYNNQMKPTQHRIAILLTSDEEGSAIDGTPVIVDYLKKQKLHIKYCLLGEPTSVNNLGDTIKIGRRGSLTGNVEVQGKQGHIAYPHLCINPIHLALPALTELSQKKWDDGTEYFPPTSLQINNIYSGLGVANVIPDSLTSSFNFRYNNLHSADYLACEVESILTKHKLSYKIKWRNGAQPFYTKPGRLLEIINNSIKQELQTIPQAKTDGGTSDGRFLVEVCDEIVEFGLNNKYIHQINEKVITSDLYKLSQTYYLILLKIFDD